jgi:phosphoadenosine phosphosulfate reductase
MTVDIDIFDPRELHIAASELEGAHPSEIVSWAVERFGSDLTFVCSFQSCVLIDMAVKADPMADIIFLDTGFHFPETLEFVERVRDLYQLHLRIVRPVVGSAAPPCGQEGCCNARKLLPLDDSLDGQRAWASGLKRADTSDRADAPIAGWDHRRAMVKVNPLAAWSENDVARYARENSLPVHPLSKRGFTSIGCAPTTTPVLLGEDRRAGRWRHSTKTECGLHL